MQPLLIFLAATIPLVAAGPLPAGTTPACGNNKLVCCNGMTYFKTSPILKLADIALTNDSAGVQVLDGTEESNCINYDARNGICQKSNNLYCCDGFVVSSHGFSSPDFAIP
ncbi:hypothetical protein BP5796_06101 [Coleophoma crateriformis]|uniref:Hydrophobin n=1 Tax=Coleophoma crateriformis TaxID=565419 RepID=A0A3D8RW02_9HELO|nr:hypothetical protein BP5796_06101 [Coleophoma crateriformis]